MGKVAERMLEKARSEAEEIKRRAEEEAQLLLRDAQRRKEEMVEEFRRKAESAAEMERNRILAERRIKAKHALLAEKVRAIEEVFAEVEKRLLSLGDEEYLELLASIVKESGFTGGELVLSPPDRERLGRKLVERLGSTFTLASGDPSLRWGVLVREGKRSYNGSIEVLLGKLRDEHLQEVARILFG